MYSMKLNEPLKAPRGFREQENMAIKHFGDYGNKIILGTRGKKPILVNREH